MWDDARTAYIRQLQRKLPRRAAHGDPFRFEAPFLYDIMVHFLRMGNDKFQKTRVRSGAWDCWNFEPDKGDEMTKRMLDLEEYPCKTHGASRISFKGVTMLAFHRDKRRMRLTADVTIHHET